MNIVLTDGDVVSENRIIIERDGYETYLTLPRHKPRVTLYRHKGGRGQLVVGGFKTTTVSVVGSIEQLEELREAVL